MAEQKITVRLDPMQVNDLKQFVRDEIEKERRATMRVAPSASDTQLRKSISDLADAIDDNYKPDAGVHAGVVASWLRALLG